MIHYQSMHLLLTYDGREMLQSHKRRKNNAFTVAGYVLEIHILRYYDLLKDDSLLMNTSQINISRSINEEKKIKVKKMMSDLGRVRLGFVELT